MILTAQRGRAVDRRRARHQVRDQRRAAGARARHRGAGRANRLVKKGDVLFRIDPTPYELTVRVARGAARRHAGLARASSTSSWPAPPAGARSCASAIQQADARAREVQAQLDLARKRVEPEPRAGGRPARATASRSSRPRPTCKNSRRSSTPRARCVDAGAAPARCRRWPAERQIRQRIGGRSATNTRRSAQVRAQLEKRASGTCRRRRCSRRPTATRSTCSCVRARSRGLPDHAGDDVRRERVPGHRAVPAERTAPGEPGNEAEFTLRRYPATSSRRRSTRSSGRRARARCADSAQLPHDRLRPMPPGRFPVKLTVDPKRRGDVPRRRRGRPRRDLHRARRDRSTSSARSILRVGAKLDYLVLKLH